MWKLSLNPCDFNRNINGNISSTFQLNSYAIPQIVLRQPTHNKTYLIPLVNFRGVPLCHCLLPVAMPFEIEPLTGLVHFPRKVSPLHDYPLLLVYRKPTALQRSVTAPALSLSLSGHNPFIMSLALSDFYLYPLAWNQSAYPSHVPPFIYIYGSVVDHERQREKKGFL